MIQILSHLLVLNRQQFNTDEQFLWLNRRVEDRPTPILTHRLIFVHGKLKRGRGTLKQPVFGVFERDGRVYTEIVPDCKRLTLQAVILVKYQLKVSFIVMGGVVIMVWLM